MPLQQFICKECGKVGYCYPSQARKFCSSTCNGKWHSRVTSPPRKPRRGRVLFCGSCGADVYRSASGVPASGIVFCSAGCHNEHQRRNSIQRQCEECGEQFQLSPSQVRFQSGRFCSKRCEGLTRIKRPLDREHKGKPARLDGSGYVWVWEPDHPEASRYRGWVAEHRLVAEQMIGRFLTPGDEVHHINRIKHDNRPENLDVLDGVTHAHITKQQRESDRVLLARYIEKFGPIDVA